MALSTAGSAGPPPEVQLDAVKEQEQKPEPRQKHKQKKKPAAAPAPAPAPAPRPAAAPPSDRPFQLAVEPPPAEGGRWRVRLTGAGMEETASQPAAAARRTRYGCQLAVQPEDGRWRVRITTNDAAEPKQAATAERMEKLMAGIQDAQARIQALQGQAPAPAPAPARAEPPANPRVNSLANEDETMMSGSPRGPTGARNLFAPTGVAGEKVKITVKQPQRESKPQKQQSQPKPKKQKEPKAAPVETSPPSVGYSQECTFKALQLPVGEEGWDGPRAALSAAVPSSSVSSWGAAKAVAAGGKREAAAGANEYVGWETQGEDAAAKTKKARADAQARAEAAAAKAAGAAVAAAAKGSSQKIVSPEVGEWVKTAKAEAEAALVGDAAFAASPKMLAPSPLRDGPAAFDAPAPVPNDYAAAATGELRQPSLFADDAEAAKLAKEIAEEQVAGWVQKQQAAEMAQQAKQIAEVQVASWVEKQDAGASGADAAFAAAPKMLAPSPLRDGPAAFDAPAPVRNDYAAAATGDLRQPSLFEDSPASKAKSEKARNAEHDTPRTAQKRAEVLANVLKAQAKTTPPQGAQR